MGWIEDVEEKFASYNKSWIDECFISFSGVGLEYIDGRWRYTFRECKPKEWCPNPTATVCGDTGGTTASGKPCRKRVRAGGTGRCGTHAVYDTIVLTPAQDCKDLRPFPASMPLKDLGVSLEGTARVVSPTHVWNEIILVATETLVKSGDVHPEAYLNTPDGTRIPSNPLWPCNMLIKMYPDCNVVRVNGHRVRKGYTLEDLGVTSGSEGTLTFD